MEAEHLTTAGVDLAVIGDDLTADCPSINLVSRKDPIARLLSSPRRTRLMW